jgi:hypothetical protein
MKKNKILNKALLFLPAFVLLFLFQSCAFSGYVSETDGTTNSSYNLADLNNYGYWINTNSYGKVWHPYAVNNWMPFDNGHWSYIDGNWTWVSYEPFGWIVYHYGDWYDDPTYGWVWIPSNDSWSPANVNWINYGNYIGWAPLGPRGVAYGYPWERNYSRYWHVVRENDFTKDNIRDYRVTNVIRDENGGRAILNRPPDRQIIEKNIGRPIPEVRMQREQVNLPDRNIERMNLPREENQRIEQNSSRIRRDVLVPREKFRSQQDERNSRRK